MSDVSHDDGRMDPKHDRAGLSWRTIDTELAELAYDSVSDRSATALVRGSEGTRSLIFEAPSLTLDLEVTALGARRRLMGQLSPPQPAHVMVRHQDGIAAVEADGSGRFRVDDLPVGPGSLRCRLGGEKGANVVTDWVTL
jgi:hypothetical protein